MATAVPTFDACLPPSISFEPAAIRPALRKDGARAGDSRRARFPHGVAEAAFAEPVMDAERDRLIMANLPMVRFIARRIHERLPQHVDFEDMVSAGVLGLIDAFSRYDGARHVQFHSYAQFRVRGAILDSLRAMDWGPRELRRKGRAIEEATRTLTQRLGRAPQEQELAGELGMELGDYQHLLGELKGLEIGSLHVERNEDAGDEELAYIPGDPREDPLRIFMRGEMRSLLHEQMETLTGRERMVLNLYYQEELTMKEIGSAMGVVESRISQIRTAAIGRLRMAMAEEGVLMKKPAQRMRERTAAGRMMN